MNEWRPIAEYSPDLGRVLVWLEWKTYSQGRGRLEKTGEYQPAYTVNAAGNAVWVTAHDSIPMETANRRVTHFMLPQSPHPTSGDSHG